MLQTAQTLRDYLTSHLEETVKDKAKLQAYAEQMKYKFDLPSALASDFLSLRVPLEDANEFVLFMFLTAIAPEKIPEYFTKSEIRNYQKSKYEVETIKFPLTFTMLEVVEDEQWIGSVSARELLRIVNAQLVNYNENTQRRKEHIVRGETEYYRITRNEKAIKAIGELLRSGTFVSNTITLNIPEEEDDPSYDPETLTLTINHLDHFDILDGYHRYIGLSKAALLDKDFDYPMELRIVHFSESKANQFIWQEDQKTKMRKVDSDFLNQQNSGNKVVNRLNADGNCALSSKINQNDGIITASEFAIIINLVYFSDEDIRKNDPAKIIGRVKSDLMKKINAVTELDDDLIDHRWSKDFLLAFTVCCKNFDDPKEILKRTRKLCELGKEPGYQYLFADKKPSRQTIHRLKKVM